MLPTNHSTAWLLPEPELSTSTAHANLTFFPPIGTQLSDLKPAAVYRMKRTAEKHNAGERKLDFFSTLPTEVVAMILLRIQSVLDLKNLLIAIPEWQPHTAVTVPCHYGLSLHEPVRFASLKDLNVTLSGPIVRAPDDINNGLGPIRPLLRLFEVEDYGMYKPRELVVDVNTLERQLHSNGMITALLKGAHKSVSLVSVRSTPTYTRSLRMQHDIDRLVMKGCSIYERAETQMIERYDYVYDYDRRPTPVETYYRSSNCLAHNCEDFPSTLPSVVNNEYIRGITHSMFHGLMNLTLSNCLDIDSLHLPFAHSVTLHFPQRAERPSIKNFFAPYLENFEVHYYEKPPVFTDVYVGESAHTFDEPEQHQRRIKNRLTPIQHEVQMFKLTDDRTEGTTALRDYSESYNRLHADTDLSFTKAFQVIEICGGPTDELLSRLSFEKATHLVVREQRLFKNSETPSISMPELTDLNFDTVIPGRTAPAFKTPKLKNLYLRSTAPGFDPEPALDASPADLDRLYVGVITRTRGGYDAYEFKKKHMEKFAERIAWLSLQGVACSSLGLPSNEMKMPRLMYAVLDVLLTEEQRSRGNKKLRIRVLNYSPELKRLMISQDTPGPRPWWSSVDVPHVHSRRVYVNGFPGDAISLDGHDQVGLLKIRDGTSEPRFFENLYFRAVYGEKFMPSTHVIVTDWEPMI